MKTITKLPAPLEKEVQKAIIEYLRASRFMVWRNNTINGPIIRKTWNKKYNQYVESNGWLNNGSPGSPDIIGFSPEGFFIGIEVKREGKKLTPLQVDFAKRVRSTKFGIFITARSIDDVQEQLEGFKQIRLQNLQD